MSASPTFVLLTTRWHRQRRSAPRTGARARTAFTVLSALVMALIASTLPMEPVRAQVVAGVGDDAIPLPKGVWQVSVAGLWNDYDAVYAPRTGSSGGGLIRQGLYAGLSSSAAGVSQFPTLSAAQTGLRTLSGDSKFSLSLGALEASGVVRQSIAPITIAYGFRRRVSFRVVVPYAESRDVSQLLINRSGTGANVGVNPAYGTSGSSARTTNGSLLSQIDAARTALSTEITRCNSAQATSCDLIRANAAGAQALLDRALTTRDAIAAVYGTAAGGGAPVVPITGSTLQTSVVNTIAALRTDFAALGVTSIQSGAAPAAASTVMGPGGGITRIATDTAFHVGYRVLGNTRRAGVGDIDLTTTLLLFDTFQADPNQRLTANRHALRSTVTAGWRFGMAGADRTDDAFDVPIGEGANAILVRSSTDLVWNRALWMSATVRVAKPLADQVAVILPYRDLAGVFAPVNVGIAQRSLGMRYDIELAPRLGIGEFFGISAGYLLRHWGSDRYTAATTDTTLGASVYQVPGRSLHSLAFGASFSTLASYMRHRSRIPAEVVYTHMEPFGASGGTVAAMATDHLELKLYLGFPRR